MTESESRDHTLKEWENELNKDLLFLENILGQDDSQKNAPEHIDTLILKLEKFFREADMGRGPEIIEKITQIKTDEYATKIFLNIIQQLVKAICIAESLKELGLGAIKVLPNFFDEQSTGTKKKELFNVFYKKYSSLMPKFKQAVTATDNFSLDRFYVFEKKRLGTYSTDSMGHRVEDYSWELVKHKSIDQMSRKVFHL
jgi:hypothetical protein